MPAEMSWMYHEAIVLGLPVVALLALGLLYPAYRALRGDWRSWTVAPKYAVWQSSERNNWPFSLLFAGLAVVVVMPTLFFEAAGWEAARRFMWAGPFWIPWAMVVVSIFWWPKIGPEWYRCWREAGGNRWTMPFTDEEIASAEALPEGSRKKRLLRNIEASRRYILQGTP
jgi:hypothetical protein